MLVLAMQFSSNKRKAKAPDPNPTGQVQELNGTFKAKETTTGPATAKQQLSDRFNDPACVN